MEKRMRTLNPDGRLELEAFRVGWDEFERRAARHERVMPLRVDDVEARPEELPRICAAIRGWNTAYQFLSGKFDINAWRACPSG
jgi:hypothetical protein